jgi:hypothetical protein
VIWTMSDGCGGGGGAGIAMVRIGSDLVVDPSELRCSVCLRGGGGGPCLNGREENWQRPGRAGGARGGPGLTHQCKASDFERERRLGSREFEAVAARPP